MKSTKQLMNWVIAMLLTAFALPLQAQTEKQFSVELTDKALPAALKIIEKEGGKNIIFSYNETESYRVTASIKQKTEAQAIGIALNGTPFIYKERNDYFVVQKKDALTKTMEIRGTVTNEKNEPLAYSNVLLLTGKDSTFVTGCVTQSDGSFLLQAEEGMPYTLEISFLGYRTQAFPCRKENNIRLTPDTQWMDEVTITANRPLIEKKANGLKANIIGTSLAKMGSAAEMISHLPFVTGNDGNYNVLGHGAPIIYINSRKVRDSEELDRLRADEIVSAEVITTPGAEYGPEVRAVIRIRTIRQRGQGLSGNFNVNYSQGHSANGSEQLSLNYRTGKLDIFVKGYTSQNNYYTTSETTQELFTSSNWNNHYEVTNTLHTKQFSGEAGFNYEPNEHHSFGMRYMPNTSIGNNESGGKGTTIVTRDGKELERISYEKQKHARNGWNQSLNAYYIGELGKWKLDFNADYLFGRSHSAQQVVNNGNETVESNNRVRNYLYAARLVASTPLGKGHLSFGTEEVFTNRHDVFLQNGFSNDADDHMRQSIYSLFADYGIKLGKFNLSAGLRYEHQQTNYYEKGVYKEEQSPSYDDLIPVVSANYANKDWNVSLSYRLMKFSPSYSMLTSAVSYTNKYEYRIGDPFLEPQKHNYFSFDSSWKWLYASIYFDYVKNMYTSFYRPYNDETHPGVLLDGMGTIPDTYQYGVNIGASPKIGCWQPSIYAGMNFYDADVRALGITQSWNEAGFSFNLDNSFELPNEWFINLNGSFSPHSKQSYAIQHTSGRVNARISKSFLPENALMIALTANDILHTSYTKFELYGDRTHKYTRRYQDSQRFGIQISYKFNTTKSKYKGTGAGQSEKQRL